MYLKALSKKVSIDDTIVNAKREKYTLKFARLINLFLVYFLKINEVIQSSQTEDYFFNSTTAKNGSVWVK